VHHGSYETDKDLEPLLRQQWESLRSWLDQIDVLSHRDLPSDLGAWTVGDLVAHLGLGIGMVAEVTPAPEGSVPLSFGTYVAAYPPAATSISDATRALARELGQDLLGGVDAIAAGAWRALSRNDATVVLGRRGPISRPDYLVTRLLELVVHGDDLHRAVPASTERPSLPRAEWLVAGALAHAYEERAGEKPDLVDATHWIRLATGRLPSTDGHLPLL
jgi:uncharacterized protein (TIGR03083 family)